ncbi:MAG: 3-dehydroquinate synthase [Bacteroides sp.]
METLVLNNGEGTCVYTDTNINILEKLYNGRRAVYIIDQHIRSYLPKSIQEGQVYEISAGEHSKSLREASEIYRWLQDEGVDRDAVIVGIGGGVVTDLSGFVAATYMRGIALILVPTTLLAQVDASIGGKNAVNLHGFKNIIGTFYQPEAIICDYSFLRTLPIEEIRGGVAEMIKHCMIADATTFNYFATNAESILALDPIFLQEIIPWSIQVKNSFIENDIEDHNLRHTLNFGHTWGHAIESVTGIHHGLAVAIGMCFATRFALYKGLCSQEVLASLESLLTRFGLPTSSNVLPWVVFDAMKRDKKRSANCIHFILPVAIGHTEIVDITFEELKQFIKEAFA